MPILKGFEIKDKATGERVEYYEEYEKRVYGGPWADEKLFSHEEIAFDVKKPRAKSSGEKMKEMLVTKGVISQVEADTL